MEAVKSLPVAVIGAGPVGLATAAHLEVRVIRFILFEAGATCEYLSIKGCKKLNLQPDCMVFQLKFAS